jgi:hypothetical protein
LYQTLAKAPLLGDAERALSTRHFLRELNRFGVTSAIDPSGGFQSLAILSADYFTVPDGKIADIEPLCMVADGRVVYAAGGVRRAGRAVPGHGAGLEPCRQVRRLPRRLTGRDGPGSPAGRHGRCLD